MKMIIKFIIFLSLLFGIYAVYLYFHDKSLPNYQINDNGHTEVINGEECFVYYAYYNQHTYKSFCSNDDYDLGHEIGKADKQMVYSIKGNKDMIAIQGIFMSVPTYFKKIK
ncbi:hypothetical protein [Gottfriedia luciferensis]|uniref:hypothetical protein n=1 Tax=Gottfriedia luciferensis TaxID=178774 RepID=UPI000B4303D4|nr:hypothetical protein [Gottfriedia luciferensis]